MRSVSGPFVFRLIHSSVPGLRGSTWPPSPCGCRSPASSCSPAEVRGTVQRRGRSWTELTLRYYYSKHKNVLLAGTWPKEEFRDRSQSERKEKLFLGEIDLREDENTNFFHIMWTLLLQDPLVTPPSVESPPKKITEKDDYERFFLIL